MAWLLRHTTAWRLSGKPSPPCAFIQSCYRSYKLLMKWNRLHTNLRPSKKTVCTGNCFPFSSNSFWRSVPNLWITMNRYFCPLLSCWPDAMNFGTPRDFREHFDIHSLTENKSSVNCITSRLNKNPIHPKKPFHKNTKCERMIMLNCVLHTLPCKAMHLLKG